MTTRGSQVRKSRGCCAELYELPITHFLLGDSLHPGGRLLTRKLAEATVIGRETRVLDIACGNGDSARLLAFELGCDVVGLDQSGNNIARATRLAAEAGLSDKVKFVQGDANSLDFANNAFDVVCCECALCTFADVGRALAELRRVLKVGGRVGISDIVINDELPDSLRNEMGQALCLTGALTVEAYQDALDAAGFSAIYVRDHGWAMTRMLDGITQRLKLVRRFVNRGELTVPDFLLDAAPTFAAARDFVTSGHASYAILTARKT